MALSVHNTEIVIALNKKLVFLHPTVCKITKQLELDPNIIAPVDSNPEGPDPEAANENAPSPTTRKSEPLRKIQHIKLSPNGHVLAVTTTGRKMLLLYRVHLESLELLSSRRICRASSALTFSSDSTKLLLCDKTGDCYIFDCENPTSPGKWILGHLSMVLDVRFAPNMNAVITADRDEKIRVTNFPETHEIECYCLGHLEYVSSVEFLPFSAEQELASLSGDKTCRIWNYRNGRKLHQFEIPAPGIKMIVRPLSEQDVCHLAVLLFQPEESIFVYQLKKSGGIFESSLLSTHSFPGQIVTDLEFCGSDLYLTASTDACLGLKCLKYENGEYKTSDSKRLDEVLLTVFENEEITDLEDISGWFKKKFDNVSDYMERKKRRIEEKSSKIQAVECK